MDYNKHFCVYILASKRNGTLYVGITSDLVRRVSEHKSRLAEGFTSKYGVDRLVYFEVYENAEPAIRREKNMKAWKRMWKLKKIEESNPNWDDLFFAELMPGTEKKFEGV